MNTLSVDRLLADLARVETLTAAERRELAGAAGALVTADDEQVAGVITALEAADLPQLERSDPTLIGALCEGLWRHFEGLRERIGQRGPDAATAQRLSGLYRRLGPGSRARFQLLRALAEGDGPALTVFAELVVTDPPQRADDVLPALAPLFMRRQFDAAALFPRLLDAIESPVLAAAILDLANHLSRSGRLPRHPAADRSGRLAALLCAVVERLRILEERGGVAAAGDDPAVREQAAQQVADAVALCVTLCDALALIGDRSVVGKIRPALELAHRRVRTEAAGALARLGEQEGIDALAQLVAEPVARLRALAYLDELGLLERAAAEFRSPLARAEAALACWLAEPTQFGFPPQRMELVDQRRLYWPGFDEPQECFLFRYIYPVAGGRLTGVGIAGPATHAVGCDLEDYPPTDIYALYAGAQAEHEEIVRQDADSLSPQLRQRIEEQLSSAAGNDYTNIALVMLGRFFGESLPVATAESGGRPGVLILDDNVLHWYPRGAQRAPLGPIEAWWMHIGRKILRTFNPDGETTQRN